MIALIAALTKNHVIGKDNTIPWRLPEDFAHFKKTTLGQVVVMGRKTYDSLPQKFRPLPYRKNIVISRSMPNEEGIVVCRTLEEGLNKAKSYKKNIFIIGGASLYAQALEKKLVEKMYLSYLKKEYDGDAYFPKFNKKDWQVESKQDFAEFEVIIYGSGL